MLDKISLRSLAHVAENETPRLYGSAGSGSVGSGGIGSSSSRTQLSQYLHSPTPPALLPNSMEKVCILENRKIER